MSGRLLRASAALVVAAGLLVGCVSCTSGGSRHAIPAGQELSAITWRASDPSASVVFGGHSARIFDGCDDSLRAATIGDGVLELGKPIGHGSACSPATNWPPPAIARFDRVLAADHLSWQRIGQRLQLIDERGDTLELHASGPAVNVAGQHWLLEQFNDLRGYTQGGRDSMARLLIVGGTLHAEDACSQVSGSATVTDTTITFGNLRWTTRPCTDPTSASLAQVMHRVLAGTIKYTIRGDELMLYGRRNGLLVYTPAR